MIDGLDTEMMNFYFKDFSRNLSKDVQAFMVVDGASWHCSEDLVVPDNVILFPLPAYSPELNPIEQIWAYLKSNYL